MNERRIVPSGAPGEISIDTVADDQSETTPAPANPQYPNAQYTVEPSFMWFLNHSRQYGITSETVETYVDLLGDESTADMVRAVGSDFFSLVDFRYKHERGEATYVLIASLKRSQEVPYDVLKKRLVAILGSEENFDFMLQTDVGAELGLEDPTKDVDIDNKDLLTHFPSLKRFKELEGSYALPADPHVLLLGLPVEQRRFLSLCFDEAYVQKTGIFSVFPSDNLGDEVASYGFTRRINENARDIKKIDWIELPTFFEVGRRYEETGIKQYMEALETLRNQIR